MSRNFPIISLVMAGLIWISCNNKKEASPYSEILAQPLFAGLTDSIRKAPGNDELYFRRAVLLNSNNFPEPALVDFQKAWSLKKDERYAYGLGNLLLDKKPDSAILFLDHALKELPGSFLLELTLAHAYEARGKIDEALEQCEVLLQKNPEQVDVLKMKASLLDKKGRPAEAIAVLEKAYGFTPFDIDLNYELAYKYAENKNPKVIALCDSLISKDSLKLHAEPYYYKGIYFSNTGNKPKALELFDVALQRDYYFLNAYIEKARVLYDQKKYADALKTAELANTISATFPDAYFWMGKCQEALGQKDEARLNYQRAYGLDNSFTEAKEAADKLK